MKKIISLVMCAILLFTCAFALFSCGEKGKTLDEVKESGKLVVATSPDFPPFETLAEDNKTVIGIEVEILEKVCAKLGVELEIVKIDFDAVLPGVQTGKYDCGMSGISITEKRQKNVLFTDAYCLAAQCIVVKADSPISSKADLEGKKIAVQSGTTAADFCSSEGYDLSQYDKNPLAKLALTQGKVDAWVVDDLTAAELCKDDPSVKILNEAMTTEPYAFAFAFGSETLVEEINTILAELMADGTVKALFEKYDAPYTAPVK